MKPRSDQAREQFDRDEQLAKYEVMMLETTANFNQRGRYQKFRAAMRRFGWKVVLRSRRPTSKKYMWVQASEAQALRFFRRVPSEDNVELGESSGSD